MYIFPLKVSALTYTVKQQESTKTKKDMLNSEGQKGPKVSMVPLNKASYRTYSVFKIGPPAWIKKEINTSTFDNSLVSITSYILFSYKYPATYFYDLGASLGFG